MKWIWKYVFIKITDKSKLNNKILKKTLNGVIFFVFFSGVNILWERTSLFIKTETIAIEKLLSVIPKIIYSLIVFSVSFIVSRIIDGFVEWYLEEIANKTQTKVDEEFMNLFQKVSRIIIFFIAITIILNKFNQPITSILGAAGIASFAIAFAAQDTLSNMISGFFLIIDKPFKIGDRIKLATGEIGEVIEIGMRRTKILSSENNVVIVSNSEIAKTRIVNFGYPDTKIRVKLKIGVQAVDNYEKIKKILLDICNEISLIITQSSNIYAIEINNSQIIFLLTFIIDYKYEMEVIEEMIKKIIEKLKQEKVEILFIKRD
ncbi:MAG: mechanosensitive ion channel family protein [Candidatus Omnitrophica bacterium]|nr:mechanosensitive ion channel family protein [Candidatus Omnitrophota bacterium]